MSHKPLKKIKSLGPKPLTIKLHGSTAKSPHTTNLRKPSEFFDSAVAYTPEEIAWDQMEQLDNSTLTSTSQKIQKKRVPIKMLLTYLRRSLYFFVHVWRFAKKLPGRLLRFLKSEVSRWKMLKTRHIKNPVSIQRSTSHAAIPANAGIQNQSTHVDSRFRGNDVVKSGNDVVKGGNDVVGWGNDTNRKKNYKKKISPLFVLPYLYKFIKTFISFIAGLFHNFFNSINNVFAKLVRVNPLHSKALVGFFVAALILVSPIPAFSFYQSLQAKGEVIVSDGQNTAELLELGTSMLVAGDFLGAGKEFSKTLQSINHIQSQLESLQNLLPALPRRGKATLAKSLPDLTQGTKSLSLALLNLSQALQDLTNDETLADATPVEMIKRANEILSVTLPRIKDASNSFDSIDAHDFPQPYKQTLVAAQQFIPTLQNDLQKLISVNDLILEILGEDTFKRYLVVFQNDSELRPTGGFIGSLAILDIDRGKIKNLEIPGGGPYDFQGQQSKYVKPPQPLLLVNERWELQDANWFPDFPTSAKQIMWFWENAKGPTVDGVIAVNSSLLENLLQNLPPIDLPEYNTVVTAANVIDVTQSEVELDHDKGSDKPKQFIADLAPKVLQKLFEQKDGETSLKLALGISQGLTNHDIQMYLTDNKLQKFAQTLGIDGSIVNTEPGSDYLYVVNANVGGGKTDRVIEQQLDHQARVLADGSVIDTITIKRTHGGTPGETFYGADNINHVRVYVPLGSKLVSAHGVAIPSEENFNGVETWYETSPLLDSIDSKGTYDDSTGTFISEESGKTVFAHWTHTKPGQTSVTRFTYKLPFKLFIPQTKKSFVSKIVSKLSSAPENILGYNLYVQKQPGARQTSVKNTIVLPQDWQLEWDNVNYTKHNDSMFNANLFTDRDSAVAVAAVLE